MYLDDRQTENTLKSIGFCYTQAMKLAELAHNSNPCEFEIHEKSTRKHRNGENYKNKKTPNEN